MAVKILSTRTVNIFTKFSLKTHLLHHPRSGSSVMPVRGYDRSCGKSNSLDPLTE
jgi:hypothetical protein